MSLINQNRNQHLNPEFNAWLTHCVNVLHHGLTVKDRKFLRRCYNINVLSGIPLCYEDFKDMWKSNYKGNFRAIKHKLNPLFETVLKGKPTYYKLNGLYLDKELINEYTSIPVSERIFANLNILLSITRHERPQMHALLFQCKTFDLYTRLIELGYTPNKKKAITINEIPVDKIITASATIYSNNVMLIRLGCTYFPIDYSNNGWISLISLLSKIEYCLKISIAQKDCQIEPVKNWKLKHFDMNKDSIHYDFPTDDYTVSMIFGHIQVYNKRFPDGRTRIRVEEQLDLDNTITEELSSDRYQKASELHDIDET
ncbi:MAG: hypothetical protein KC444_09965 [Nitrosopumilus sp.]|nr:hypothetical protein [Nitrosopumilus sp.]